MKSQLPEVKRGEPVSADLFNALVRRVNELAPQNFALPSASRKGEFWIKNESNATLTALSFARVDGFRRTFADENAAKSAIASDAIIFSCAASNGSGSFLVQTLDGIKPGSVGRACLPYGALVFAFARAGETIQTGARVDFATLPQEDFGKMLVSETGAFRVVAFDSTSRLIAVCSMTGFTQFQAGDGISITTLQDGSKRISDNSVLAWGCWNGTRYPDDASFNVAPSVKLRFGSNFQAKSRQDDGVGFEIGLKTTSKQVTTGATPTYSSVEVIVPNYAGGGTVDPTTGNWTGGVKKQTIQICTGLTPTTESIQIPTT